MPESPGAAVQPAGNGRFPVAIVGDGLVGKTLACTLANHGVEVVLTGPQRDAPASRSDSRPIALAFASRRILEGAGQS